MRVKKVFAGALAAAMLVCAVAVPAFAAEEVEQEPPSFMRAEFYEELPYFVVEKNDQNDNSDADELVHYGAHELHVENTGYDHPYPDKDEDTGKDVYRSRLFHKAI